MGWLRDLIRKRRPEVHADHVQHLGARGSDVQITQQHLNYHGGRFGIRVVEDGIYGPQTQAAVQQFQLEALGLRSDGFIGPQTARRLHLNLVEDH